MPLVVSSYLDEAARFGAGRRGTDAAWLADARRRALDRFDTLGFPTMRDEEWRFTSIAPIAEGRFTLAEEAPAHAFATDRASFEWRGERLVFSMGSEDADERLSLATRFVGRLEEIGGLA